MHRHYVVADPLGSSMDGWGCLLTGGHAVSRCKSYRVTRAEGCPRDTDGDGNCGQPACPVCRPNAFAPVAESPHQASDAAEILDWLNANPGVVVWSTQGFWRRLFGKKDSTNRFPTVQACVRAQIRAESPRRKS